MSQEQNNNLPKIWAKFCFCLCNAELLSEAEVCCVGLSVLQMISSLTQKLPSSAFVHAR